MTVSTALKNNIGAKALSIGKSALKFSGYLVIETLFPSEIVDKFLPDIRDKDVKFSKSEMNHILNSFKSNLKLIRDYNLDLGEIKGTSNDNSIMVIPIISYNTNLSLFMIKLIADKSKSNKIEENNFAILVQKNPVKSEDRVSKVPSLLRNTNKWFNLSYDFVYLPNSPSVSSVEKITSLGNSDSFRIDIPVGNKTDNIIRQTYQKNKWQVIDGKIANKVTRQMIVVLNVWMKKLKDPSYLEQLLLAANGILSLSDISIQEAKRRIPTFKTKLKREFGSDNPTLSSIDMNMEFQLVDGHTLLYIFDPKQDTPMFRDFSIGINLRDEEVTFSYNNASSNFKKKTRAVYSKQLRIWKGGVAEGRVLGNKQWENFEYSIIESLKDADTDVLDSFINLFTAMK